MATSQNIGQRFAQFRNFVLEMLGRAAEFGTATAVAGAATLNTNMGIVTSEALTTAQNALYTLVITNSKIAVGDMVLVTVTNGTNTAGTPMLANITIAANTLTIVVSNQHASAVALNGSLQFHFEVIKKLSTITPNF